MQKLDRTGTASRYVFVELFIILKFAGWSYICFLCSIAGSLGTHVNNAGATLPMAPILGAATIPSLATPLATVPAFPVLGAGVQVPTVTANLLGVGTPSECLLLKNMFDPTAEVYSIILKIYVKFSVFV